MNDSNRLVIKGVEFAPILSSSIFEFFLDRWYVRVFRFLQRTTWRRITFVSKLTTLEPVVSSRKPIVIRKMFRGYALVVRSFSNLGLQGEWRGWLARREAFFVTAGSLKCSSEERVGEFRTFVKEFARLLPSLSAPVALLIDTTIHHHLQLYAYDELVRETHAMLEEASVLNIPIAVQVSVSVPVSVAAQISEHPLCDVLSLASFIPWGGLAKKLDWLKLFGGYVSPLAREGHGELYGEVCMPFVKDWVSEAKYENH